METKPDPSVQRQPPQELAAVKGSDGAELLLETQQSPLLVPLPRQPLSLLLETRPDIGYFEQNLALAQGNLQNGRRDQRQPSGLP